MGLKRDWVIGVPSFFSVQQDEAMHSPETSSRKSVTETTRIAWRQGSSSSLKSGALIFGQRAPSPQEYSTQTLTKLLLECLFVPLGYHSAFQNTVLDSWKRCCEGISGDTPDPGMAASSRVSQTLYPLHS